MQFTISISAHTRYDPTNWGLDNLQAAINNGDAEVIYHGLTAFNPRQLYRRKGQ